MKPDNVYKRALNATLDLVESAALVEDYFGAPPTWDTTVVLDRIISAQNAWLASYNKRQVGAAMSTLTALALRGQTWTVAHVGDTLAGSGRVRRVATRCRRSQP